MHFRRRYCLPRPQLRAWSSSIRQVDQSSSSRVTLSQGQSSVNFLSSSPSSHSPPLLPKLPRSNIWLFIAHQYPKYRDTMDVLSVRPSLYSLGWSTFLVVHINTRCNCLTRRHGVIAEGVWWINGTNVPEVLRVPMQLRGQSDLVSIGSWCRHAFKSPSRRQGTEHSRYVSNWRYSSINLARQTDGSMVTLLPSWQWTPYDAATERKKTNMKWFVRHFFFLCDDKNGRIQQKKSGEVTFYFVPNSTKSYGIYQKKWLPSAFRIISPQKCFNYGLIF